MRQKCRPRPPRQPPPPQGGKQQGGKQHALLAVALPPGMAEALAAALGAAVDASPGGTLSGPNAGTVFRDEPGFWQTGLKPRALVEGGHLPGFVRPANGGGEGCGRGGARPST